MKCNGDVISQFVDIINIQLAIHQALFRANKQLSFLREIYATKYCNYAVSWRLICCLRHIASLASPSGWCIPSASGYIFRPRQMYRSVWTLTLRSFRLRTFRCFSQFLPLVFLTFPHSFVDIMNILEVHSFSVKHKTDKKKSNDCQLYAGLAFFTKRNQQYTIVCFNRQDYFRFCSLVQGIYAIALPYWTK